MSIVLTHEEHNSLLALRPIDSFVYLFFKKFNSKIIQTTYRSLLICLKNESTVGDIRASFARLKRINLIKIHSFGKKKGPVELGVKVELLLHNDTMNDTMKHCVKHINYDNNQYVATPVKNVNDTMNDTVKHFIGVKWTESPYGGTFFEQNHAKMPQNTQRSQNIQLISRGTNGVYIKYIYKYTKLIFMARDMDKGECEGEKEKRHHFSTPAKKPKKQKQPTMFHGKFTEEGVPCELEYFEITPDITEHCLIKKLPEPTRAHVDAFIDYHKSVESWKPRHGKRGITKWRLAFYTWMRNDLKFEQQRKELNDARLSNSNKKSATSGYHQESSTARFLRILDDIENHIDCEGDEENGERNI